MINHKIEMLRIIGVYTLSAMITSFTNFIFMPTYAANVIGLPLSQVSFISTIALACVTFLVPVGGYIFSDCIGRKPCYVGLQLAFYY